MVLFQLGLCEAGVGLGFLRFGIGRWVANREGVNAQSASTPGFRSLRIRKSECSSEIRQARKRRSHCFPALCLSSLPAISAMEHDPSP